MKKIVYRTTGTGVHEVLVTNRELADAVEAWLKEKNYNCARLGVALSRMILFTTDREHEKRFRHFINTLNSGEILQVIFDEKKHEWYEFDKFTNYEDVVNNLVTRERGGDAPLFFIPKSYTPEKEARILEVMTTVDEFFDNGGQLGY